MKSLCDFEITQEGDKHFRLKNGKKEEVSFYVGFGWLTASELWQLRQDDPRNAP